MFCKYKNIFGKPKEGLHKFRLFDIGIIDVAVTVVLAYIIHILIQKYGNGYIKKINFVHILMIVLILGVISHRIFCVRTTVDKWLFP